MENKWKFIAGIICCIIGIAILATSLFIGRFIPGGFVLLAIGIILIMNSKEK